MPNRAASSPACRHQQSFRPHPQIPCLCSFLQNLVDFLRCEQSSPRLLILRVDNHSCIHQQSISHVAFQHCDPPNLILASPVHSSSSVKSLPRVDSRPSSRSCTSEVCSDSFSSQCFVIKNSGLWLVEVLWEKVAKKRHLGVRFFGFGLGRGLKPGAHHVVESIHLILVAWI